MTCFWLLRMYELLSLDGMALTTALQRVTRHIGVMLGGDGELWTYLEYKILMSSDATVFSVIAVAMGTGLVFWIRKSQ